MKHNSSRKDAAVSETVGYIYIFAIVMFSMSMIYVMGYPALQNSMKACTFESTQQSFIVLQSNMKMVAFDQTPVKNLNIQLQSATVSVCEETNITIEYGAEKIFCNCGMIEYQQDDMFLTYENGGVWKRYPGGGIKISNPRIYTSIMNGTNFTTLGIVCIQGTSSSGGKGIATISMKNNISIVNRTQIPVNVSLKINSTYAPQWQIYLESIGFTTTYSDDTSITVCNNNTYLAVGRHIVDVEIV